MPEKPDLSAARHAAWLLAKEFNITRPERIALEDIAMARGAYVFEAELQGAEARLVRKGTHGIIRLKKGIPELGRKRFAIAHEIGHWELHKDQPPLSICTADDVNDFGKLSREVEANAFAGSLLMPTQLMSPKCWEATPDLEMVCNLSTEFGTTVTATAVRFVEECRQTCVAVFSQDRKVKWWRARGGDRVWLQAGYSVDERSSAWEPSGRAEMEQVDTDAWFPDWKDWRAQDVYEQSMVLGRYGTVLTLLWVVDPVEESNEEGRSR
jgi:Zn-dependent peptidase ImmA (M78 family)